MPTKLPVIPVTPVTPDSSGKPASDPWFADGLRFSCTQCGNCCTGGPGYVWLTREEAQRLADFLGESLEQTIRKYCRNVSGKLSLRERVRDGLYDCIFLEEVTVVSNKTTSTRRVCSVYEVRPTQCRTWPFWDGNLASPEAWRCANAKCPGIDRGKKYSQSEIERRRDA